MCNYLKYNIQIEGLFLEGIVNYNYSGNIIKKIILKQIKNIIEMTIELDEKIDETILEQKQFIAELRSIVNKIKLVTKKYVSNPICVEKHVGHMCTCDISVEVTVTNDENFMELLRQKIEDANYEGYIDFKKEFLDALSVENHYARFMLLYGMLYDIKETQHKTDQYIEQYWSSHNLMSVTRPSRKNPNMTETIYTYLRNCYGHLSKDVDIEKTNKEIDDVLEEFTEIVYSAIF